VQLLLLLLYPITAPMKLQFAMKLVLVDKLDDVSFCPLYRSKKEILTSLCNKCCYRERADCTYRHLRLSSCLVRMYSPRQILLHPLHTQGIIHHR